MKYPLLGLIRLYQWTISPLLGPVCKYYPSCSHYGYQAISVHGAVKGSYLTVWRILRCNPWSAGGVDHVPPRKRPPWHERLRLSLRGRADHLGGEAHELAGTQASPDSPQSHENQDRPAGTGPSAADVSSPNLPNTRCAETSGADSCPAPAPNAQGA